MFAIDQQQYLQGYLPVVFAMLYVTNLNTVGNGAAGADRARDHQRGERDAGGASSPPRARARTTTQGRAALRPPAPLGRRPVTESQQHHPSRRRPTDERLTRVSPLSRLLARPDIGAMIGAVVVWLAFGYFARGVNWLGDPGNAAGWTDQAAQYGIVAVPVALLMIGGEFDLSAGVMIGSSGLLLGYLATHAHMNIWPAIAVVFAFGAAIGFLNGCHGGEDEAAELHRHARDVLRPPGRQRRAHAEAHRHDRDPEHRLGERLRLGAPRSSPPT